MKDLEDLREDIERLAKEIGKVDSNPERWDTPVIFLIEAMEIEAMKIQGGQMGYEEMVEKVRDALTDWLEEERW